MSPLAALRPADAPAVGAPRRPRPARAVAPAHRRRCRGHAARRRVAVQHGRADPSAAAGGRGARGRAVVRRRAASARCSGCRRSCRFVGRALARTGTSARLAAANTVRNPRRTAATSAALLIGATLVAMMSTGAASARVSLARSSTSTTRSTSWSTARSWATARACRPTCTEAVAAVTGVGTVLEMRAAPVMVGDDWITVVAPADGSATDGAARPAHGGRAERRHAAAPEAPSTSRRPTGTAPVTAYATPWDDPRPAPGGSDGHAPGGAHATSAGPTASSRLPTLERLAPQAPVSMLWVRWTRAPTRRWCSRTSRRRCPTPRRRSAAPGPSAPATSG